MTQTMAALAKGDRFDLPPVHLANDWVDAYVAAVEDSSVARLPGVVPPMGLAALTVRALLEQAPLPDGAIHAGQELSFQQVVRAGDPVAVSALVANRSERAGWVLLVVELSLHLAGGDVALRGKSTLTFRGGTDAPAVVLPQAAAQPGRADSPVLTRELTQQKINAYADASGDHNPLHIDPEYARGTRFGGTIAHGMLLLSYLSEAMLLELGENWIRSGALKLRFRGAARPGDTVRVYRQPRGENAWEIEARNAHDEVLVSGQAGLR